MTPRHRIPTAVFLILTRNDNTEVLLARRHNTGWSDGNYSLPAGHTEPGEPLRAAAHREAHEELDITIHPRHLTFTNLGHTNFENTEYIQVFFHTHTWHGIPKINEPHLCDDLRWYPLNNLPPNITPEAHAALTAYNTGHHYHEAGFTQ